MESRSTEVGLFLGGDSVGEEGGGNGCDGGFHKVHVEVVMGGV
eukprot:CAMPEP_0184685054 /NCGR_PEP_ID=MMETSP0312-20130426/17499_1 /TAXON_ID=31354 /ORGANISM="Compsopogon coeruleus, Strain SAG 36.94" /LENGTH=42 /DNA_ID= /DNA_START= /DNA_END= /DNA_ORIENTATION=